MIFLSVSFLLVLDKSDTHLMTLVQYVPESISWLSYKPLARYGYNLGQEAMHGPMEFVREGIVSIRAFKDV